MAKISLFQVGTQRVYHYRFQVDGKRVQRSTKEVTRGKALQIAEDHYRIAKLRARGEEPEPTVGKLVEQWVEAHTLCLSPSHVQNVERFGRLHLGALKDLQLTQLTTACVEEARTEFLKTHARSFANQWITYLNLVCHWAIRRKMIRQMPYDVPELKIKRQPKRLLPAQKTRDWLEEVDALTEHEPAVGLAIRLMVGLGLRGGEARGARWEWLDLERVTYTPGNTKGGEAWARPVPDWLMDILRPIAKPFGPMLTTSGGRMVSAGRIRLVVDVACKSVGIPKITPHRLRGSYATWLSEAGVPIQDIARALEHKDIKTTAGYLEVDLSRVAEAQKRVAERLGLAGRKSGEPPSADGGQS